MSSRPLPYIRVPIMHWGATDDRSRRSRRHVHLARRTHALSVAHPPVRQGDVHPRPDRGAQDAIGKRVTVIDYPGGRLAIRYKGADLPYRTFDKIRHVKQADIVENKRLGALLEIIQEHQRRQPPDVRGRKGPKRRDQTDHMFSVG
jgi:hypothetical protein